MQQRSVPVRDAVSTFDEGLRFARYLDQAADGFFELMLGGAFTTVIAEAYLHSGHDLSYEHVVFAEHDGEIVGMASGYTAAQHRRSSVQPLNRAAGYRVIRMMCVGALFFPLLRFLDTLDDGDFYVQFVAVDRDCRGVGIGSILLDTIEARARASGARRLTLDVSATNRGARRLYERRGMSVVSQSPKLPVLPHLRAMRMAKLL